MKRCVIYSRVSSQHQDFERQVKELKKYVKDNNYKIDLKNEIFAEKVSVTKKQNKTLKERERFNEMLKHIDDNGIDLIIMWEVSRLARNAANALTTIEELAAKNINIHFYKEGLDSLDSDDKFAISILCAVAEKEAKYLSERVRSGKKNSAERGTVAGFYGKSIPYGYKSVKKSEKAAGILTIDKEESKIIKQIFDWAEGKGEKEPVSIRQIAIRLNRDKVKTRWAKYNKPYVNKRTGKSRPRKWQPNAVSLILHNPIYKGIRPFKIGEESPKNKGEKPKPIYEKLELPELIIIEPEQWDRVQTKIRKRNMSKNNAFKYQYLFRDIIRCTNPNCGRTYRCYTEKRYGIKSYYRCYGSSDIDIKCDNGQFLAKAFDQGVYSLLFQHRDLFPKMRQEVLSNYDIDKKREYIEFYRNELDTERKTLQYKLKHRGDYITAYGDQQQGTYQFNRERKECVRKINEFEREIKIIESEIEEYQNLKDTDVNSWLQEIDLYETTDFDRRSEFVKKYVNEVFFTKIKQSEVDLSLLSWYKSDNVDYFERIDNAFYEEDNEWKAYKPDGRDSIGFVEIYAFDNPKPIMGLLANRSLLYHYAGDWLKVYDGILRWKRRQPLVKFKEEKSKLKKTKEELEKERKKLDQFLNNPNRNQKS